MKKTTILTLLWFAVWCVACSFWYVCRVKQACNFMVFSGTRYTNNVSDMPFCFAWSSANIQPISHSNQLIDSLAFLVDKATKLEIIGLYHSSEVNHTNYTNLGIARATAIKHLFINKLPKEQIVTDAKLLAWSPYTTHSCIPVWFSFQSKHITLNHQKMSKISVSLNRPSPIAIRVTNSKLSPSIKKQILEATKHIQQKQANTTLEIKTKNLTDAIPLISQINRLFLENDVKQHNININTYSSNLFLGTSEQVIEIK